MGYITTKKGVKWVRLVITDDLVSVIGKKNLMESLETKDNRLATERAPAVIAKFQQQIAEARGLCLRSCDTAPRNRDSRDQPWRFWRSNDAQK